MCSYVKERERARERERDRMFITWLPLGAIVVPFCGSYLESYKVIPKRNYYGYG